MQQLQNNNNNISTETLKEFSSIASYLGLAALIISIYSDETSKGRENAKADPIFKIPYNTLSYISLGLIGTANLIELGVSKTALDKVNNAPTAKPIAKKAATNLLASRVFSIIAIIFLTISEVQADQAEIEAPPIFTPTVSGAL